MLLLLSFHLLSILTLLFFTLDSIHSAISFRSTELPTRRLPDPKRYFTILVRHLNRAARIRRLLQHPIFTAATCVALVRRLRVPGILSSRRTHGPLARHLLDPRRDCSFAFLLGPQYRNEPGTHLRPLARLELQAPRLDIDFMHSDCRLRRPKLYRVQPGVGKKATQR